MAETRAVDYVECVADDGALRRTDFVPRAVQAKEDEIVIFAWITYESRDTRDAVTRRVMEDPRMDHDMASMPSRQAHDLRRVTPFVELDEAKWLSAICDLSRHARHRRCDPSMPRIAPVRRLPDSDPSGPGRRLP